MLVLARREQEKIVIADGRIIITVVAIKGGCVRIGIEADRSIPVVRGELVEQPALAK